MWEECAGERALYNAKLVSRHSRHSLARYTVLDYLQRFKFASLLVVGNILLDTILLTRVCIVYG